MKKIVSVIISVVLAAVLCVTAFAVQPRWKNVISISPTISAASQTYTSYIVAVQDTTKIEVDRTSSTYYGFRHEFSGSYDIKSGKTYKLTTTITVTANGTSETVSYDFEKRC